VIARVRETVYTYRVIVAVGNQKGGVGKTTIAIHLAAAWVRARRRIVLVDADQQASAAGALAQTPDVEVVPHARAGLGVLLEQLAPRYDAVIVDCPPGLDRPLREAINAADLVLVPLTPNPVDVRAVRATLELIQVLRGKAFDVRLVLNRLRSGTVLAHTVREGLAPYGVPILRTVLGERVAVAEAAAWGRPVQTYAPESIAASEFDALAREVWDERFATTQAGRRTRGSN
jgi:chromosome partitioning protein